MHQNPNSPATGTQAANAHLKLDLNGDTLTVTQRSNGQILTLAWPAVSLSFEGRKIHPATPAGKPETSPGRISQCFTADGLRATVTVSLAEGSWFTKNLALSAEQPLPTPDFVEVDRQLIPSDVLRRCGYQASTPLDTPATGTREEEGSGGIPGCGYPLIGRCLFTGLEHPAAFNHVDTLGDSQTYWLRHYPVWNGQSLEEVNAVFGWGENGAAVFADYLQSIRLPMLKRPLVAVGTFWSDPYLGDGEYAVTDASCAAFIQAFESLGLKPDYFTLDAGWNNRQSLFKPKSEFGLRGLEELRRLAGENDAGLSLWISHNGHIGIDPDFMQSQGFAVGSGQSSHYSGQGFGVLMDKAFEKALTESLLSLVRLGTGHFKIDWDNDCATHAAFAERYPTRNHVRQASLNTMFRIGRALRTVNPGLVIRNGWWPSPWWLPEANHVWLSDSGDSEFSAVPSATARDASMTHRDAMYFNHLRRDHTPLPLDCFDNHEFPNAPRNPFPEDPSIWANACWMAFFRGSTYVAFTLAPESLEDWQADSLREIMRFCRLHADSIYGGRGRMILGHPGRGEIYGFQNPGRTESWMVLRNPLPIPQTLSIDAADLTAHPAVSMRQFYPHHELLPIDQDLCFLAHEVKLIIISAHREPLACAKAHQIENDGDRFQYRLPASLSTAMVDPMQRVTKLGCLQYRRLSEKGHITLRWALSVPQRCRKPELQFRIKDAAAQAVWPEVVYSRYPDLASTYTAPVTRIAPGSPGYGEQRNTDGLYSGKDAFFTINLPSGGCFHLSLTLPTIDGREAEISAWMSAYEAPSREPMPCDKQPDRFAECLPYPHPLGFPKASQLPTA